MKNLQKDEEIFEMAFTIWYLFLYRNGEAVGTFIEKIAGDIKRQRTLDALKSWLQAPIVLGEVTNRSGAEITVVDSKTGKTYLVHEEDEDIQKGTFIISIILDYHHTMMLFGLYFIFPGLGKELSEFAKENVLNVEEDFFKVVNESFSRYENSGTTDKKPLLKGKDKLGKLSYDSAIDAVEVYLSGNGESEENIAFVKNLLSTYLERETPSMRNPNVYAAAAVEGVKHYLPNHVNLLQKEIAASFSVSPQSISKKSRDIIDVVQDLLESKEGLSVQR
ncbi:hypothetical protein [Bacillus coahuilensis]|uniref:hypothetical protein n=1 Tax=Bacillus coahuilensis TaxID=408580 RepID=UPI0001850957|nr:hypothetical protein [Bacillus coahuilensis]